MVTNCQAQVALDIVLQQEQIQSRALELGEKSGCPVPGAWI